MCGIIGIFNREGKENLIKKAVAVLKNRGKDGIGYANREDYSAAHCLHSVVGFVKQPLIGKGVFVSNCEIYNWKELSEKYGIKAENDSEMIFKLFEKRGFSKELVEELDGDYAFAYIINDKVYLARDNIGVKPLWFSLENGFAFASEKKVLEKIGYVNVEELNPRKILVYDIKKENVEFIEREFFKLEELKSSFKKAKEKIYSLLEEAVRKRIPDKKLGLLFSGGIDSTILAVILKKLNKEFTCYTTYLEDDKLKKAEDLVFAEKIAKELGLKLKTVKIKNNELKKLLKKVVPLIEDNNVIKVGVGLTFFSACEEAKKDKCKVILSGLGAEEIFGGYSRHRNAIDLNKECLSGLLKIYERDLYRDDVIAMFNNLELRVPFLDKKLIEYALKTANKFKTKDGIEKYILRKIGEELGLRKEFAYRKKKAAQYGSNIHKAIRRLAVNEMKGKNKFGMISEYLREYYPKHNLNLAALVSGGKDSLFAAYIMIKQNYNVKCLVSLKSKNLDSYMFHTPTIELVKLQAESMELPLIFRETKGEKEKELEDLKKALEEAKEKYNIQGVITGALYSSYQRDRIEKIADRLGLKIFSPLWHVSQENELRELLKNNFRFIITKVAAEGLDSSFLGKEFDEEMLEKLKKVEEKHKINMSGEGGEFESFVVDCGLFKKKIRIFSSEIVEDGGSASLVVNKARLEPKGL